MKKLFIKILPVVLTALSCVFLVSCIELGYSPVIQSGNITVNGKAITSTADTLGLNDTLRVELILNGYDNELQVFTLDCDREYLKDSIFTDAEFKQYCTPNSNREKGYYEFYPGRTIAVSTLSLIPKKMPSENGKTFLISMTIQSNRKIEEHYNPNSAHFNIRLGVKKAPVDSVAPAPKVD